MNEKTIKVDKKDRKFDCFRLWGHKNANIYDCLNPNKDIAYIPAKSTRDWLILLKESLHTCIHTPMLVEKCQLENFLPKVHGSFLKCTMSTDFLRTKIEERYK